MYCELQKREILVGEKVVFDREKWGQECLCVGGRENGKRKC